jgi:RHS repeat-associated protein
VRTREGTVALEYDARGRLASKREPGGVVWRYHWNDADQLVQVDRPDGTAVAMSYDALGRRLSKNHLGKRTCFVWDADVPLHEWSEAAELVHRRRTKREEARAAALLTTRDRLLTRHPSDCESRWQAELANAEGFEQLHAELRAPPQACDGADGPLLTWLFEPGSFAPLARLSADAAHAIVADHVGTPLVVLDDRGTTRAQYIVDTYGRATTAGAAELCPFRFAGQYLDAETGLHYNRFRHYDPSTGEYTSRDPLGLRGGLHAYAYVDDPTTWTDPLGLSKTAGAGESCGGAADDGAETGTPRLPRDIAVNPSPPAALPLGRPIARSTAQNERLQADIAALQARGAKNIRVNQQQVDATGERVGINRPDLQYTLDGKRYYVEYDAPSSTRGPAHRDRILANDPEANVILIQQR